MKYSIVEKIDAGERTAWSKARADAAAIAADEGYVPIEVCGTGTERENSSVSAKLRAHACMGKIWKRAFSDLGNGDELFIQLPVVNNYLLMQGLFKKLRRRGVKIIALIHDLETLRMIKDETLSKKQKLRMRIEEIGTLKQCSRLIVHNAEMQKLVASIGIETPMTVLGVFDYLISQKESGPSVTALADARMEKKARSVVIAGNLDEHKSGYIYTIPEDVTVDLYGVHYKENNKKNLHYHGSFPADKLPFVLDGGFGLIWDGTSADTCTGAYGDYLRFNTPHKTSLYIASCFPVIIWEKAALAAFVTENGIGFTVSSLSEIPEKLRTLTDAQYAEMYENVKKLSEKLRGGGFLRAALNAQTE